MRILFSHRAFPGQYRYLASVLARDPGNEVVFLTTGKAGDIPGVRKVVYEPARAAHPGVHPYLRGMENAVLYGQAAYRAAARLKRQGFVPDVVCGHSGWGPSLFLGDVFPSSPFVGYFEWFYRARGSSFGFDPRVPLTGDNEAEIKVKNAPILLDLVACTLGVSPTRWQHAQLPGAFQPKVHVLHDGIDTDFFRPGADPVTTLPRAGLDLAAMDEIVTYVATGMEPLRGFPQFMAAVALLQRRRPGLHAVIVGEDRVEYDAPRPDGRTYREAALREHDFDLSRLHFTGRLGIGEYRRVLLSSSVHVYLTYPFILSWSLLEAMAAGCTVVASDTAPVREVIKDKVNGFLVDFFSPEAIAARVEEALDDRDKRQAVGQAARASILAAYDARDLLPRQVALLKAAAGGR